ncbi:hypothetical protein OC835_006170, partial [Tilletia horrida]
RAALPRSARCLVGHWRRDLGCAYQRRTPGLWPAWRLVWHWRRDLDHLWCDGHPAYQRRAPGLWPAWRLVRHWRRDLETDVLLTNGVLPSSGLPGM